MAVTLQKRIAASEGRFATLTLKNVRCFDETEIVLDPRITVIIGENGAGKTTVAEIMASLSYGADEGLRQFPLRHGKHTGYFACNRSRGSRTKCLLARVNLLYYPAAMDTKPSLPPEVWERTPVEAQEYIRVLEARVAMLETIVQRLQATVQQLTERVQQDSRTSSRPPSSDPPSGPRQAATARAQWTSAWRAAWPRGANPRLGADRAGGGGHPGQARALRALSAPVARGRWSTPTASSD